MRLLFATLMLVEAFLALALLFVQRTRRVYPGFGLWTLGETLTAMAYLLFALRGRAPDWVSMVAANTLLNLSTIVRLHGTYRFLDVRRPVWPWYAVPVLSAVVVAFLHYAVHLPPWRTFTAGLLTAAPAFHMAGLVIRRRGLGHRRFSVVIGAVIAALGSLVLVQGTFALLSPGYSLLQATALQQGTLLAAVVLHPALTMAFLMLNAARVEGDLAAAQTGLQSTIADLQRALAEVKTLKGLLPICARCKKVRDDAGYWTQIEVFVSDRSEAEFSHGICPDCARQLYPDLMDH